MPELLAPANARLWLDDHAYTARLLANDAPPLLGIADYVAFRRQATALLASDVTPVPLETLCAAWLDAHPELVEAMGAKSRAVAPLRAMLADAALRGHLTAALTALRQAFAAQPLVITLPSPRAWVGMARARAGVEPVAVGQAEADSASVYVAEFLRAFGACELDAVLLVERAEDAPATAGEIAWYQPLFNVAAHFRWKPGVLLPGERRPDAVPEGVDFVVARAALDGVPTFVLQPPSIWAAGAPPTDAPGPFTYAEIPRDAAPEQVLAVIDGLRARQVA